MKNILTAFCIFTVAYYMISCTKGGDQVGISGNVYTVNATASSKLMIPAIDTTSTGTVTGWYDEQSNILTYTIAWNDLWRTSSKDVLTSIKFYNSTTATGIGTLTRSIGVVNNNNIGSLTLSLSGSLGFSPTEKNDFIAGNLYIVLCTTKFPNGIIRGKLITVKQ